MKFHTGLSRRSFLNSVAIGAVSFVLWPFDYASARNSGFLVSERLIKARFKFLSPYQAALVEEVSSIIVADDEGTTQSDIVFEIDRIVADSKKARKLYSIGLKWLDYMAGTTFKKKSFLLLTEDEKVSIINIADSGNLPDRSNKPPRRQNVSQVVKIFFEVIKQHTFEVFYSSKAGWESVGYSGPPQWIGNRDYYRCSL